MQFKLALSVMDLLILLGSFGVWTLLCVLVGSWMRYRKDNRLSPVPNEMTRFLALFRSPRRNAADRVPQPGPIKKSTDRARV
jgi:hypothetical protein